MGMVRNVYCRVGLRFSCLRATNALRHPRRRDGLVRSTGGDKGFQRSPGSAKGPPRFRAYVGRAVFANEGILPARGSVSVIA